MNSLLLSGGRAIDPANRFDSAEAIAKYPVASAKLFNRAKGSLFIGADGDVAVFDPDADWVFEHGDTESKSRNSPFHGWPLKCREVATIVGGKKVWAENVEPVVA